MFEISLQRVPAVSKRLGRCRATLHQDVRDGVLTPPITIGSRWTAWPSDEIDAIARARIAGWSKGQLAELVKELVAKRKTAAPPMQGRIAELDGDERHHSSIEKAAKPKAKTARRASSSRQPAEA